jgi:hypothetical protein
MCGKEIYKRDSFHCSHLRLHVGVPRKLFGRVMAEVGSIVAPPVIFTLAGKKKNQKKKKKRPM